VTVWIHVLFFHKGSVHLYGCSNNVYVCVDAFSCWRSHILTVQSLRHYPQTSYREQHHSGLQIGGNWGCWISDVGCLGYVCPTKLCDDFLSPHTSVRPLPFPFVIIQSVNAASFCGHFHYTDMRRLTTGIRSEIRVIKRFRLCANVYLHKPR
jgi:hypothetical protein